MNRYPGQTCFDSFILGNDMKNIKADENEISIRYQTKTIILKNNNHENTQIIFSFFLIVHTFMLIFHP